MPSAKRGDQLLLKLGDGGGPEVFTSIAGLRTKSITGNGESVDVTSADDTSKYRQLLQGAGIRSLSVSGSGVFKDATVMVSVHTAFDSQTLNNWQIVIPGLGTYTGAFQVTQFKVDGEFKGEMTYDISLESAGDLSFA